MRNIWAGKAASPSSNEGGHWVSRNSHLPEILLKFTIVGKEI